MRIFKQVPRILFGRGALERMGNLLPATPDGGYRILVVDAVHRGAAVESRLPLGPNDMLEWFDAVKEPSTAQVDALRDRVRGRRDDLPTSIIGVGGGSAMDVAKALAVVLTNPGSSADYQGWDLVNRPAIHKIGVPTVSGSGAEASRTAVLMGRDRKFGINSDYSMFDAIVLDPGLTAGVPAEQRFHSGMDCYIHCVESLLGTMINELAGSYAGEALRLCEKVFLGDGTEDDLMVASYMGGCSIVNSEVGVCHALSYGLSLELGLRHGFANCVAFDVLDEYYGAYVDKFRAMLQRAGLTLPKGLTRGLDDAAVERMVAMTQRMERPLTNALGENWRDILTPDKIRALYARI